MSGTIYSTTQRNTLKRDDSSGSANLAAPSGSAYSGIGGLKVTNMSVSHGLGYPPVFRVSYEPFGDGVIWLPLSGRTDGNAQKPTNTLIQGPGIVAWVDATAPYDFHIQLFSTTTFTGTFPVYWVIYRDFAL